MNTIVAACVLVSLPMAMGLNCYQCAAGSGGCSDPFNKTGSGVSTTGTNNSYTYCEKLVVLGVARRSGETKCTATGFHLNSGTGCCQTDLCNGAYTNYQVPIMLIVGFIIILAKFNALGRH